MYIMDDFNSLHDFVDYIDRRSKLLNNDFKIHKTKPARFKRSRTDIVTVGNWFSIYKPLFADNDPCFIIVHCYGNIFDKLNTIRTDSWDGTLNQYLLFSDHLHYINREMVIESFPQLKRIYMIEMVE